MSNELYGSHGNRRKTDVGMQGKGDDGDRNRDGHFENVAKHRYLFRHQSQYAH